VTCLAFSRILTVRLPVPGPTSRTLSVGLRFAFGRGQNFRLRFQPATSFTLSTILQRRFESRRHLTQTSMEQHDAHPCATRGFFRICCPNRSVLKIGFLVPDDEGPELSFVDFLPDFLIAGFTEGSCPREKRSEVARGMVSNQAVVVGRNVRRGRNKKRALPNRANRSYQITPTTTDRSVRDRHGHPRKRPRERHQGRIPNNSPGNRGHLLRVRGKLLRVHCQLR
jgi:hypothetical protein